MDKSARSLLSSVLRTSAYGMAVVAAFSFFVNLLVLVSPIYMQQVYDRVLTTHHLDTLVYLSIFTVICLMFLALFDGARTYALNRIGRWWDETLRAEVLHAALFQSRITGRLATSALNDLQTVRSFVGSANILPFFDAPWMPLFLLIIALIHPVLGAIGLAGAIILFGLAVANDIATRRAITSTSEHSIRLSNLTGTAMRNADVVHAMGMFGAIADSIGKTQRDIADAMQVAGDRAAVLGAITKAIRIGLQVAILGIGAYYVTRNELTAGGMIAASIILGRALAPVEQALGAWRSFVSARASHLRLKNLLAHVPLPSDSTNLPAPKGALAVEKLVFTLPGRDRPIISNVDFRLEPGSVVAIVGPSASGKSTLCKLLVGSWPPTAGYVRLDGADIGRWNRADVGRHVGYMPQSIELFGGTIRDNIARFEKADDEEIVAAAIAAGCHDLILRLPQGYESDIGEAGSYLSGGQRQRIALARALFRTPKLIVLDEPNSNLDAEGEAKLIEAIKTTKERGSTIVIVSHRTPLFANVDLIAVMREGVLERFGPRDTIMAELAGQARQIRPAAAAVQAGQR